MEVPARPSPDELLAQVGWVRRLALQVAGDPNLADDLSQEALILALERIADPPRAWRAWLATVVRNLRVSDRRRTLRREAREEQAALCEPVPSTLELVERASVQRALVDAVLALEEPYRSTLLLRYFEELGAREIAGRTGVSESTVATRTAEALRRLRARLAREGEEASLSWLRALLPALRWPSREPGTRAPTGVLAMSLAKKLALVSAVAAGSFLAYRSVSPASPREAVVAEEAGPGDRQEDLELALEEAGESRAEVPLDGVRASAEAAVHVPLAPHPIPHPAHSPHRARGRVVDLDGVGVAGVEVVPLHYADKRGTSLRTDGRGTFEAEVSQPTRFSVRSDTLVCVTAGYAHPSIAEVLLVVGWRIPLAGRVVDEDGRSVEDASVSVFFPVLLSERPEFTDSFTGLEWPRTRTDGQGHFELEGAVSAQGITLAVEAPGFLGEHVSIDPDGRTDVRVVLRRADAETPNVAGHVFHADGRPAAGALVSAGWGSTRTNGEGRFVLDVSYHLGSDAAEEPLRLVAALAGHLPARAELPPIARAEEAGWPQDVEQFLGGGTLSLSGRVVDGEGSPFRGVKLQILDADDFGLVREDGSTYMQRWSLDEAAGGGEVASDEEGRFELGGLSPRSYRVEAQDEATLLTAVTGPLAAGRSDVEIVLDRGRIGRLAGRVVDRDGGGLADVRVGVTGKRRRYLAIGPGVSTDADGAFVLEGVSLDPPFLRIEGDSIVSELFREIPEDADREELELVVSRRCRLQVEWEVWSGKADELVFVDGDEQRLEFMEQSRQSLTPRRSIRVGERGVYSIPETAAFGVLLRNGEEVNRVALGLVPGELVSLRL